jgi:hypothetical protein
MSLRVRAWLLGACGAASLAAGAGWAGVVRYEEEPIRYSDGPVDDAVARLDRRLAAAGATLARHPERGYLDALLAALAVPASSQTLVFSKTSLQREHISPTTPRALYFNDDVYVGWVPGGDVIEIAAMDRRRGAIFYTLSQSPAGAPRARRATHECLQCHDSGAMTGGVPGLIMRSVIPDRTGQPLLAAGSFVTTPASRFDERWGGWYVTGQHGPLRHLGNATVGNADAVLDREAGANLRSLEGRFDARAYLAPGSDLVALLVLAHQVEAHNALTHAGIEAQLALRDGAAIAQALGEPGTSLSDATRARLRGLAEPLLRALLFATEAPLDAPVAGSSSFAKEWAARGPRDRKGRSLRDLDLRRRLLRHPLSPLVHTEAFDALPAPLLAIVYERLGAVLSGADRSAAFAHLSAGDRRAILEILSDTKRGLPASWKSPGAAITGAIPGSPRARDR